jgi:hypothetical protein
MRCARAAHDDGEDVDFGTWPMVADGICEGCVFGTNQLGCLGKVVTRVLLPLPYLNLYRWRPFVRPFVEPPFLDLFVYTKSSQFQARFLMVGEYVSFVRSGRG